MPLHDHRRRLLLTAAPGTASTSLVAAFAAQPDVERLPAADVVDGDGWTVVDAKHATAGDLVVAGLLEADHGLTVVTSTRNPFDHWPAEWRRTRTRWVEELRDPGSWVHRQPGVIDRIVDAVQLDFDPWLTKALGPDVEAGRTRHLNPGHVGEADVVLRMEHLAADLGELDRGSEITVPHLNVHPDRRPYWQYYGPASRAAVEAVHAPDLARFGYRF